MNPRSRCFLWKYHSCALLFVALATAGSLLLAAPASAQFTLVKISTDNFTNADSQHKSEVEPDTASWGNTIVSTFQVARRPGWGGADIGFATSNDGGTTWKYGYLPGLTVNYLGGHYYAASDPSVAYDAKHNVWLISTLPLAGAIGDVAVSRSTDGGLHWGNPIVIDNTHTDDKNWTTCDNNSHSPYYGHCYTEWDAAASTGDILMSTSTDGGLTWSPGKPTADFAGGLGGQPLVQPNGTVVVPFTNGDMYAFTSTNGGATWNRSVLVATAQTHLDGGGIRNPDLPSAEIGAAGKVYLIWNDCRFRTGCNANDVVMSTSTNGTTWTAPARVPIDPVTSTVDHFIPGIGVDPATPGSGDRLTIVYYYYPVSACSSNCQLDVGFTSSIDGGKTWTAGKQLAGPMQISWLPNSDLGPMVADYIHVAYSKGKAYGVFAVAHAPSHGVLDEAMYTTKQGLVAELDEPTYSSAGDLPIPNAHSDHPPNFYYDDEGRYPIPPARRLPPPASSEPNRN